MIVVAIMGLTNIGIDCPSPTTFIRPWVQLVLLSDITPLKFQRTHLFQAQDINFSNQHKPLGLNENLNQTQYITTSIKFTSLKSGFSYISKKV